MTPATITEKLCAGRFIDSKDWISNGHWAVKKTHVKSPEKLQSRPWLEDVFQQMRTVTMNGLIRRATKRRPSLVAWRFHRAVRVGRFPVAVYRHRKQIATFSERYVRAFGHPVLFGCLREHLFYAAATKEARPWLVLACRRTSAAEIEAAERAEAS